MVGGNMSILELMGIGCGIMLIVLIILAKVDK
jgi:hypothetical protein